MRGPRWARCGGSLFGPALHCEIYRPAVAMGIASRQWRGLPVERGQRVVEEGPELSQCPRTLSAECP